MNIKINYRLNGELGQVIVFRLTLASHVVANLAMKGATDIEIQCKHYTYKADEDKTDLVEKFRLFIQNR